MQGFRNAWREAKNIAFGYSDIQAKLRDATSVDRNGPSTAQLQELAAATHHPSFMADLVHIFNKRLNDHGKYWRHVYKTLVVLEFCVIFGSEAIVSYAKDSIYTIKTLKEFIHLDEKGRDKGILVREKSKDLVELLSDELLLAQCRHSGHLPNYCRPKSADPILVDPKQRKRLGRDDGNYSDLQNVDETEAMRMALTASRSDNARYQSLELDEEDNSSEDESMQNRNPFSAPVPAITMDMDYAQMNQLNYNPFMVEANLFVPAIHYETAVPLQIENNPNPFMISQFENPMPIPQIKTLTAFEPELKIFEPVEETPFIPRPNAFAFSASENTIAAKPVGPHMAAPQFSYSKSINSRPDGNPFDEEDITLTKSGAQNSPHFNLQK